MFLRLPPLSTQPAFPFVSLTDLQVFASTLGRYQVSGTGGGTQERSAMLVVIMSSTCVVCTVRYHSTLQCDIRLPLNNKNQRF